MRKIRQALKLATANPVTMGWPATVPFIFLHTREGSASATVANAGNIGPVAYNLTDAANQRTADLKLKGVAGHGLFEDNDPEDADVLSMLDFFKDCSTPGIGGKVLFMACRAAHDGTNAPRLMLVGTPTIPATQWQILIENTDDKLQFRRSDSSGSIVRSGGTTNTSPVVTGLSQTSDLLVGMSVSGTGIPGNAAILSIDSASQVTLDRNATATGAPSLTFNSLGRFSRTHVAVPTDSTYNQWCIELNAYEKDYRVWKAGVAQTVSSAEKDSVTDLFIPYPNGEMTANGVTLSLLQTFSAGTPGARTWNAGSAMPIAYGDLLVADVTSLVAADVWAARRDKVAQLFAASPRGALSRGIIELMTP